MTTKPAQLLLTARFTEAIEYARILHIETRKGTAIPYMAHLLGVAALVMGEAGHAPVPVTEDMVVAAVLHDAVEDHGGKPRLDNIAANFGADVARMVEGLSDTLQADPHNKEPWQERKEAYLDHLRNAPLDVQLISAADKLYNARAILADLRDPKTGHKVWERFKRGSADQIWYFNQLLTFFKSQPANRIVEEFERVVHELEALASATSA